MNRSLRLLLLALLIVSILAVSGCTRTVGIARGWSGATADGDTLFFGSMTGKLVAVDISNGNLFQLGVPVRVEMERTSGGLACIPMTCAGSSTTAVPIYGSPVVTEIAGEKLVYVGGYDGKVRAYLFEGNSLRSDPRWISRQGDIGGAIVGGLVIAQNKVYFGASDGRVYALDAIDGHRINIQFQAEGKIWSTPVIDGDTLYIGCIEGILYALDTANLSEKWRFETEGAIAATAAVYDNKVFIGSFDRHLYAVDVVTGKQVWKFPVTDDDEGKPSNWFWTRPLVHNGIIYAPCLDGKVYALDVETGQKVMDFDLGSSISSAPVLVGSLVVVATQDGKIYTLDTTSNKRSEPIILGEKEKVYAPLFVSEGKIYVHTAKDTLYRVDPETGDTRAFTLTSE
jgi:outer membrane protein assembly factor BamB